MFAVAVYKHNHMEFIIGSFLSWETAYEAEQTFWGRRKDAAQDVSHGTYTRIVRASIEPQEIDDLYMRYDG